MYSPRIGNYETVSPPNRASEKIKTTSRILARVRNDRRSAIANSTEDEDPNKEFNSYLKKMYADLAYKRYETILTNEKKFDPKRLKKKYDSSN